MYGAVAFGAAAVLAWAAWRYPSPLRARWPALVIAVAVAGTAASLLYEYDAPRNTVEWNVHLGYPYGWRETETRLAPGQRPAGILPASSQLKWTNDAEALVVDLLFWANAGVIALGAVAAGRALAHRRAGG